LSQNPREVSSHRIILRLRFLEEELTQTNIDDAQAKLDAATALCEALDADKLLRIIDLEKKLSRLA
jgi:hypothetical protein